jgi:cob(I)alamin adenosyltransferase
MQPDPEREARYAARMARKKALIDSRIAAADQEQGLLLVNTGNGKGKSTAAFGLLARALGHGMKAAVVQFVKGRSDTGEEAFFKQHPDVAWHVMGEGFTWETQSRERDIAAAEQGWSVARAHLRDPSIGVLVLDELNIVLKYKYLNIDTVLDELTDRLPMQHVVVTGRGALPELIAIADTVTEMQPVKHAYEAGIKAMPGVEW